MDIDRYVQNLSEEGHGTAGRFTIDLERALAMTAHIQLPDPDFWVLKFVQAAVAAGARDIKLRFEEDQWLLRHDGSNVGRLSLLDGLGKEGPKKQMALCLRGVWRDPAEQVTLMTHYNGLTRSLAWPGDCVWQELPECPWGDQQGTLLVCRWKGVEELTPRRIARFRNAFRLAPARVWLDRECVHDPREGDRRVPGWVWLAPSLSPRTLAILPASSRLLVGKAQDPCDWSAGGGEQDQLDWCELHEETRCLPCWGMLTLTPEVSRHQLRLLHFGVEIQMLSQSVPAAASGFQSILSTSGLQLDAGGCCVVQDTAWQNRCRQLELAYQELYKFFASTAPHLNIARLFKGY
ncbi:MAG: hypothetical protein J0I12_19625 [Candidatus Eremiobacteraeota bacterium]|mgnify:CR=1 FL=1|nr:hypothetical protein [Candidatus Eremiobacteraeota bacterium]